MPVVFSLNGAPGLGITCWRILEPEKELIRLAQPGPDSLARLAQMQNPDARRRFLAGRALVRWVLGTPPEIEPTTQPSGRGLLPEEWPSYSLTHVDDLVALIHAPSGRLGIDAENLSRTRPLATARLFMQPEELDQFNYLQTRQLEEQAAYFYSIWCAKEAAYKALHEEDGVWSFKRNFHVRRLESGLWAPEAEVGILPPSDPQPRTPPPDALGIHYLRYGPYLLGYTCTD